MKWRHVLIGVVCILLLWGGIGLLLPLMMSEPNEAGVFGDQFGSVNALFSGLAFAGVIYAVILQSKELELQREELALTRAELSRSAQAQEESGRFLGEQAEVMKVTAEINALASIVQSLTGQIEFLSHTKDMGSDAERIRETVPGLASRIFGHS